MTNDSVATRAATGVSAISTLVGLASYAQPLISMCAGLIAIVAGLFAISNYLRKGATLNPWTILRDRKHKRKKS